MWGVPGVDRHLDVGVSVVMAMAPQCHVRSPGLRSGFIAEAADVYLVKWCSNFILGL